MLLCILSLSRSICSRYCAILTFSFSVQSQPLGKKKQNKPNPKKIIPERGKSLRNFSNVIGKNEGRKEGWNERRKEGEKEGC